MRLMVIVSGDYGELGAAIYFLQGLRSTQPPVLLLPAALGDTADATQGLDVRPFSNLADIARLVAQARPDTVILASGYLLAINSVLTFADAFRLLRLLKREGVTLLTSDPFLGLPRSPWAIDFTSIAERRGERPPFMARIRRRVYYAAIAAVMYGHLALLRLWLRRAWHIYPVPTHRLGPRPGVGRLCYFNAAASSVALAERPAPGPRPAWLFVLSKIDFEMHARTQGGSFVAQLAARLREGVALGRDVLLIGPDSLVAALHPLIAGEPRIAAHSDTSFAGYMDSLMSAEYAFFWNIFSFSVLHRVLAGTPVLFFDAGHLVHILPAIEQEGVRVFYDGWHPPLLAMDARLDEQELMRHALETGRQFRRIAEGLRQCLSPEELLQQATGAS
jgi:hypothetical protein